MTILLRHVALVSESDPERIRPADVMRVAAALQKQATRDLAPVWEVTATVDAFASLHDVPVDYWPIIIRDDIREAGAVGIHKDPNRQPFALVTADDDVDVWSLTCSHEVLEMLVDPFGDRLVAGASLEPGQDRVNYLVEVCDPCEDAAYAYRVNDVLVSDFYTPHFLDPVAASGVRYSYSGHIGGPRTVLEGGYLSWFTPGDGHLWQRFWRRGEAPGNVDQGVPAPESSLRAASDRASADLVASAVSRARDVAKPGAAVTAGAMRADALRAQIESLRGDARTRH